MKIINESYPLRCEICHKSDYFNAKKNYCFRCNKVIEPIINLSKYKWYLRFYYCIFISIISLTVSLIFFMGLFLSHRNRVVTSKILTQAEVTKLAEQYVIDNGYTDQPTWQVIGKYLILNSALQYNYEIDWDQPKSYHEILKNRFNMVERNSCGTNYQQIYNSNANVWVVYFRCKSSNEVDYRKLEVIMDLYGQNIKVRQSPSYKFLRAFYGNNIKMY